jgi:hypothetical protein
MIEFLSFFVVLVLVGFNLGVLLLIYQEQEKFRNFFTARPIIACLSSVVTVGIVLYIEMYLLMVAAIAIFGLIMHGGGGTPAQ